MAMQTVVLDATSNSVPWFESHSGGEAAGERIEVSSLPFSIGRSKATDLFLDLPRISRIQARIVRVGDELRIRDTGSTNGTFVNGERVQEAPLRDGDLVAFADIKFQFHMPSAEETPSPTDVIESDGPATEPKPNVRDVIDRIRKMHEVIIHRAFSNSFLPVACLDNHAVIGMDYAGIDDGTFGSHREELMRLLEVDCPLTQSMCQMLRLAATEDFAESQREGFLFLRLRGFELSRTGLLWELRKLGNIARKPGFVVIGLPYAALAEVPGTREIVQYIRSLGLGIAFTDFDGNYEQLQHLGARPGEFFKLAEALTRDIEESSERQEKLIDIVTSAKEHQGVLIATAIQTATESEVFRTVGCHLGEGPLFMSS